MACIVFVHTVTTVEVRCVASLLHVALSVLSSAMIPDSLEERVWYMLSILGRICYRLFFSALRQIVGLFLVIIYYKQKLLWGRLRDALTYWYNNDSALLTGLVECSFGGSFSPRSVIYLSICS